jgi:pseudouridine-5'-phosphate glycosidase
MKSIRDQARIKEISMFYPIRLSEDIQRALEQGSPIVALESTVISHGLPWPQNMELALALEQTVIDGGATPATIAIIDGQLCAGLGKAEIEILANGKEPVRKVSRRDIAVSIAEEGLGATTVAATMLIAYWAGIRVFATGGIGGVHRGDTLDISADLPELARTPVAVVCAGAKSILDLPRTLEWLETNSVPVIGYGTDEFPAFYARSSGLPVQVRIDGAAQAAALLRVRDELGLRGGELIAVPIPEAEALAPAAIDGAIDQAISDADAQGITGKDLTPFLLSRLATLTAGVSVRANVALLRNNAQVATEIAVALAQKATTPA